jgi:CrcB protein
VRNLIAAFLGGAAGTALRLGLDAILVHHDDQFPWSTLIINIVGSFALAVLASRLWPVAPTWLRVGLGPGLVGGFTTFSAVMVSMVTLAASNEIVLALVYLVVTLVFGFGAAALGFLIAGRSGTAAPIDTDE